MPRVATTRTKRPPPGWEHLEATLLDFEDDMREAVNASADVVGEEAMWAVHQLNWYRTRFVYELHAQKLISDKLYKFLLKHKYADAGLIRWWAKKGYEKLCSTAAINNGAHSMGGTNICRVPRRKLRPEQRAVPSKFNGCTGCASGDPGDIFSSWTSRARGQALPEFRRRILQIEQAVTGKPVWDEFLAKDDAEANMDAAMAAMEDEDGDEADGSGDGGGAVGEEDEDKADGGDA